MNILDDEGKRVFAAIGFAGFRNGTGRRIGPEGPIISTAIIITGQPKDARRPQYQECRRPGKEWRPPAWFGAKPAMGAVAKEFWRIQGAQVVTECIMPALEGSPGNIDEEGGEANKNDEGAGPPGIGPVCTTKTPTKIGYRYMSHKKSLQSGIKW